jgi:hypothetical protein
MLNETRLSFHQFISSKPESNPTLAHLDNWYGPEALHELQQVFEAIWSGLRSRVYPWDVHASRETLAILVFEHAKNAHGDFKHLRTQILQSLGSLKTGDDPQMGNDPYTTTRLPGPSHPRGP